MDSIGDYLVIIFFVLSFLSSLLKKKKKTEAKKSEKAQEINALPVKREKAEKASSKNALDFFLDAIELEQEKNKKEEEISEVDLFFEKALNNLQTVNQIEKTPTDNSVKISESIKTEKPSGKMQSYSESIISSKAKYINSQTDALRSLLKQKDSIKQFIIINEILGKPKALQK